MSWPGKSLGSDIAFTAEVTGKQNGQSGESIFARESIFVF
jgi:hypothetical protein